MEDSSIFIGIDVGTSSTRALALEKSSKRVLGTATTRSLEISHPEKEHFEQSSEQIWRTCCECVKELMDRNSFRAESVKGIGFDATCSLVVLDPIGAPLSVSKVPAEKVYDIIMWMDHRAVNEAKEINSTKHPSLSRVGNTISPEMEPPKLLWLKRNKPDLWETAGHFMDLADFLTFKATGNSTRSLCCLGCKWLYNTKPQNEGWDADFFSSIGLQDLLTSNQTKIGSLIQPPGCPIEHGLSEKAAKDLNLLPKTPVASSLIDAHSGALGVLATMPSGRLDIPPIQNRLAIVCGTSACHMALSTFPISISGIPGPWKAAVLPNFYLNEAGQNAVGSVLDMILDRFGHGLFKPEISTTEKHELVISDLANITSQELASLSKNIHIWPDYRGNRSPLCDSEIRGGIFGLDYQDSSTPTGEKWEQLILLYLAHVQAFALETRLIIDTLEKAGHEFKLLYICGGLQKNSIYVQCHADVLQRPVVFSDCEETVALGAAILGASASGQFRGLPHAMESLGQTGKVVYPRDQLKEFYDKKYEIFRQFGALITGARRTMGSEQV